MNWEFPDCQAEFGQTPLWLSGSLRPCLYSSAVCSCHLLFILSASGRSSPFSSFMPILAWNVPLRAQIFLKRSLVLPILFVSSISSHCSLKNLSLLAILWNSTFSWVYLSLSPLPFASLFFSSYLKRLFRQPFCLLVFLFLCGGFGCCFLYNTISLCP